MHATATLPPRPRSAAQADASRRNGARSRGPVTDAGRQRSALAAYRHGLRTQRGFVRVGDEILFTEEWGELVGSMAPRDELEGRMLALVAEAAVRLAEVRRQEGLALQGAEGAASLETALRYRARVTGELFRAVDRFNALQKRPEGALPEQPVEDGTMRWFRTAMAHPEPAAALHEEPEPAAAHAEPEPAPAPPGVAAHEEPEPTPEPMHEEPETMPHDQPETIAATPAPAPGTLGSLTCLVGDIDRLPEAQRPQAATLSKLIQALEAGWAAQGPDVLQVKRLAFLDADPDAAPATAQHARLLAIATAKDTALSDAERAHADRLVKEHDYPTELG